MSEDSYVKDANEALQKGIDLRLEADKEWQKGVKPSWRDHSQTALGLQLTRYPDVKYILPGLLPEGLSLLAGKPKIGKSWLALDVALAVARGVSCLGLAAPEQGDVLYCALEDNERRMKARIGKLLGNEDRWPDRLMISNRWRRLDKGGADDIADWVRNAHSPRLAILDTLATVRPVTSRDGYATDYAAMSSIHQLANAAGLAVLVLHHQRKAEAEDPIDTISGTLGIAGSADTLLVLSSSSSGKTLYVRGRDIEEAEHAVQFDAQACRWSVLGSADEVRKSETRRKILSTLEGVGGPLGPSEIAKRAQLSEEVVKTRLRAMVRDGDVIKLARGEYSLPAKN